MDARFRLVHRPRLATGIPNQRWDPSASKVAHIADFEALAGQGDAMFQIERSLRPPFWRRFPLWMLMEPDGRDAAPEVRILRGRGLVPVYSSTWMFFFSQMSLSCFGHTETVTSPRCAVRSRYMKVRAWPMPPPMLRGI